MFFGVPHLATNFFFLFCLMNHKNLQELIPTPFLICIETRFEPKTFRSFDTHKTGLTPNKISRMDTKLRYLPDLLLTLTQDEFPRDGKTQPVASFDCKKEI